MCRAKSSSHAHTQGHCSPGLGTGVSQVQTLPVALKHEKQPGLGGGGVTVMMTPDSGQHSCALWPAMGMTSGLADTDLSFQGHSS